MIIQGVTNDFDVGEFYDFLDANNHVSKILQAHFLAIQVSMLPILDREWASRIKNTPTRSVGFIFVSYNLRGVARRGSCDAKANAALCSPKLFEWLVFRLTAETVWLGLGSPLYMATYLRT